MEIQAALTRVRNVEFVVVAVSKYVLESPDHANAFIDDLEDNFFGVPVVLAAFGAEQPRLFGGGPFIRQRLAQTPLLSLPWETYHLHRASLQRRPTTDVA